MQYVELDQQNQTVRFHRPGMALDLGGIGKGFALDEARFVLEEAGVTSAFLHGGTSTMIAIGTPEDSPSWRVAIPKPPTATVQNAVLGWCDLLDEACAVSAIWGRMLQPDGEPAYGHIIDPRNGTPVAHALMAAVHTPDATTADALSTALLVDDTLLQNRTNLWNKESGGLVLKPSEDEQGYTFVQHQMPLQSVEA